MEPGQESAASAIDDTNVPSNSEELVPNPAMSTKCSHEIFSGVSFCLCDDVKDIDEVSLSMVIFNSLRKFSDKEVIDGWWWETC